MFTLSFWSEAIESPFIANKPFDKLPQGVDTFGMQSLKEKLGFIE